MPPRGQTYIGTDVVPAALENVVQAFLSGTAGTTDYTATLAGSNTIILTRRYVPSWAVTVGILGALFFLVGLLAFLYKETETLTVTLAGVPDGTRVTISGLASVEMVFRLRGVLAGLHPASRQAVGAVKLAYEGQRYVLGKGADHYGIWDKSLRAEAVERFRLDDEGWTLAWARFCALEPQNMPVAEQLTSGAPDRGGSSVVLSSRAPESDSASPLDELVAGHAELQASKICPDCAETVKEAANVCRFCGFRFDSD
jgi:hypothetical protein